MDDSESKLFEWIVKGLMSLVMLFGGGYVKALTGRVNAIEERTVQARDHADENEKRLVKLESTILDEARMREIMAEHTQPMIEAQKEIVGQQRVLQGMVGDLRVDIAARVRTRLPLDPD